MTGAEDVRGAIELRAHISELLSTGGFKAHKWHSNSPEVVSLTPQNEKMSFILSIDDKTAIKALGLEWNPDEDNFKFTVRKLASSITKRQVLSAISRLFDPLGLIGPILTRAKLLMQETWRIDRDWDERLPDEFLVKWEEFKVELSSLKTLCIPRRVIACDKAQRLFLHGFCDASERAYGACVYIQTEDYRGELSSRILCSKSRVAPIKTTTLPRLELCSAVLLTRLVVLRALKIPIKNVRMWSDSMVVLHWIRGDVSRWESFVANRVTEINETIPAVTWGHVSGKENPADVLSRGTSPRLLEKLQSWWVGPPWLLDKGVLTKNQREFDLSPDACKLIFIEERKKGQICHVATGGQQLIANLLNTFSSLTRIERVITYCRRFILNARRKPQDRILSSLSVQELCEARRVLIRYVQANHFAKELSDLKSNRNSKSSSKIASLMPFLDNQDIIRVGGRLQQSCLSFERKHPILLPIGDRFTKLLVEREHKRLLHANQQLLLYSNRQRYWILNGRALTRQVCRQCIRCFKTQPHETFQMMGNLPECRVQPSRCFYVTGVDFAGPIITLVNKGRGRKTNKSYITLFVCFATKAIHLEVTSELSTAAFMATLRRFVSRRGCPHTIWSDNGTNFVGANRELTEIQQFIRSQVIDEAGDMLTNEGINWRFLPPNSPHMGGFWEAGIKSCKYHLKRVMGNVMFTFEEITTTLAQIEACLNSRPLSPLSSDPTDLEPLTPAHFMVGGPLTSAPDVDVTDVAVNRLTRWQLIQRITQDFWKRWAVEYLSNLQQRTKWKFPQENVKVNDLVVIRERDILPWKWKLGRVIELHAGKDGLVRVASMRTMNGVVKRAINKLCKLPVDSAKN
ncbi:uncharacterized protein LOC116853593 [Odontomachus brunneus]|uniref:uncharacterized protein LOC116853593 n=1 Tax=Odontomachus brunneus TaxID=486640 RepID=UPI0013F28ED0|nr:uncharacterized protein LOC116853593 [Odontomachus brunneus]